MVLPTDQDMQRWLLTKSQRNILCLLVSESPNFVAPEKIADETGCALTSVKVQIHRIRHKIPQTDYLQTLYGAGWRFVEPGRDIPPQP
jgi:DNA-binding response OmpR family regulator